MIDPNVWLKFLHFLRQPPGDNHRQLDKLYERVTWLILPSPERVHVERFLDQIAPRLIQVMVSRSQMRREVSFRGLRGRVQWPATFRQRQTAPGSVVSQRYHDDYDLPENQLLKLVLSRIADSERAVGGHYRNSLAWSGELGPRTSFSVQASLSGIRHKVGQLLSHQRLRAVSSAAGIASQMTDRALDTGIAEYGMLIQVAEEQLVKPLPPASNLIVLPDRDDEAPETNAWIQAAASRYRLCLQTQQEAG